MAGSEVPKIVPKIVPPPKAQPSKPRQPASTISDLIAGTATGGPQRWSASGAFPDSQPGPPPIVGSNTAFRPPSVLPYPVPVERIERSERNASLPSWASAFIGLVWFLCGGLTLVVFGIGMIVWGNGDSAVQEAAAAASIAAVVTSIYVLARSAEMFIRAICDQGKS